MNLLHNIQSWTSKDPLMQKKKRKKKSSISELKKGSVVLITFADAEQIFVKMTQITVS